MPKTITIKEEVYERLVRVKREGESFSKLFERLLEGMDPLETLTRLRGCVELEEKEKMLSEIQSLRAERRI
ncbi:MAG: antitoxin VapB family protein [Candidatus Bathyarchaeia archaeon]|nr:antitoxin VapB family protein [Candidatus Bathyarchaeota archaeon]